MSQSHQPELKGVIPGSDCINGNTSTLAESSFVSSATQVSQLVDILCHSKQESPYIYVDLEGTNLSREGSISILTLMVHLSAAKRRAYLVDVNTLSRAAFDTPGNNGMAIKDILEDPAIPKIFFDVRNDSDALYAHFKIALQGVEDVQLMENASRKIGSSKRLLNGLARCVEYDSGVNAHLVRTWKRAKHDGEHLFDPKWKGGSYEVFNLRPLPNQITAYCVGDVQYLPSLMDTYWAKLTASWKVKVAEESKNRVLQSQLPGYRPHGKDKALGPWQYQDPGSGSVWNYYDANEFDAYWDDYGDEIEDDYELNCF